MSTARMLGRSTAATGAIEEISVGAGLTLSGGVLNTAGASASVAVGGVTRKAQMSVTTASATGTFTADEILVETALGASQPLLLSSYSQACNLATTGAGGMDTGSAPVSGFVSLYAIAKADGTKNILACAVATSSGSIYGGANMPSGYTYSALLGIWPTNGSSQFVAGFQLDRKFFYQTLSTVATGLTGPTTLTSRSISSSVPAAARTADIILSNTSGGGANTWYAVASDATGTAIWAFANIGGATPLSFPAGLGSPSQMATFKDVPLITSQTVYWMERQGTSSGQFYVGGYSI